MTAKEGGSTSGRPPPPENGAGGAGSGSVAQAPATLAETTLVAMHDEEAARAASFGRVVAILCAVGLVFVSLDERSPRLRIVMAITHALLGSIGTWVWWRSRDPRRYTRGVFRFFGASAVLAAIVYIHYFGVFSPVATIVVLGIAFFGQADDGRWLYPLALTTIAAYVASSLLVTLGLIPELGMFAARDVPYVQRLTMTIMVAAVMAMQLVHARSARRATRDAVERSKEAARVARTREAQLEEAKENLDAALRAGAGRGGRLTGTVVGRYRLAEIVGRGGMGEVYAATVDAGPVRRAAVKVLHVARQDEPEIVRRFLREAEIAVRVRGPNLVQVFEAGTAPDGSLYIAMELLDGTDLAALLRERSSLSVAESITLVEDVARGLETLHGAGVVHRDLKPQNLFLAIGSPTCWKILDYGVSKVLDANQTMTLNQIIGTPGYMSPEQAENGAVDARSDVFSLGTVAYRALTGRRAFAGPDTPQILYQVVYGMPVRPREVAPHLSRDIELVLAMAIAKKPSHRFASASAFASALRAAASGALDPKTRAAAERAARATPWSHDPLAVSRTARTLAEPV